MSAMCTQCHEREAVVRLTQVQEDQVVTIRLCERCAAERGVDTGVGQLATPLGGFLAALGAVGSTVEADGVGRPRACPVCGSTVADFRSGGRLGCAGCWDAFADSLLPLLRRLHGSTHHAGEPYRAPGQRPAGPGADRQRLAEQLELAVATENFELAAELRDQLRSTGGD